MPSTEVYGHHAKSRQIEGQLATELPRQALMSMSGTPDATKAYGVGASVPAPLPLRRPCATPAHTPKRSPLPSWRHCSCTGHTEHSFTASAYDLVIGGSIGLLLLVLDRLLTSRRGRRASEVEPDPVLRPEPARFDSLL